MPEYDFNASETKFAPAERLSRSAVLLEKELLNNSEVLKELFATVPDLLMVLNEKRQVIYLNMTLSDFLGLENDFSMLGLRPGEVLNCIHAPEMPGGCGTTEYCSVCGAIMAILASQAGKKDSRECRITVSRGRLFESLDLKVTAVPIKTREKLFTAFYITDISNEKRRDALERIFFHDIMNVVGTMDILAKLIAETTDPEENKKLQKMLIPLSTRIIDEIRAQRALVRAEKNELPVKPESLNTLDFVNKIASSFARHELGEGKKILISPESISADFKTDPVILGRVMVNMIKNALEGSRRGDFITLKAERSDGRINISVNNPEFMPREVQLQVFQRSFSTKSPSRGLGTYGMKLLAERYLNGSVYFSSSPEKGTTFTVSVPLELTQHPQ